MSAPAPSNPADAAAAAAAASGSSLKNRPRHVGDGTDHAAVADPGEEKISPVAQLYQHALESVFSFLSLADLSRTMRVSLSWSAAVRSMPSIGATVNRPLPPLLFSLSGLASHVGTFGAEWPTRTKFDCNSLFIVSRCVASLTKLVGVVAMPQPAPLCFPAKLATLSIRFTGRAASAASINAAIVAISRLASLKDLRLVLPSFFPALSFAPLATAAKLQDLTLEPAVASQPTAEQMDQLRTLCSLSKMNVVGLSSRSLEHLLRTPHDLAWQRITDVIPVDAGGIAALSSLPSLTSLDVRSCPSLSFLSSLKELRMLTLVFSGPCPDAIVEGLSQCTQLRALGLGAPMTSAHVNDILAHLPLLGELTLWSDALESLAFFSEPKPIPCKLTRLTLIRCRNAALHSTELKRLSSAPSLTILQVYRSLAEPLDVFGQWMLTPPTTLLPNLKSFVYVAP